MSRNFGGHNGEATLPKRMLAQSLPRAPERGEREDTSASENTASALMRLKVPIHRAFVCTTHLHFSGKVSDIRFSDSNRISN